MAIAITAVNPVTLAETVPIVEAEAVVAEALVDVTTVANPDTCRVIARKVAAAVEVAEETAISAESPVI